MITPIDSGIHGPSGTFDPHDRREIQVIDRQISSDLNAARAVVDELCAAVEDWAICGDASLALVRLALEECVVNAIIHGNLEIESGDPTRYGLSLQRLIELRQQRQPYRDRIVRIHAAFCSQQAEFAVQDQGRGFELGDVPDPTRDEYIGRPCGRGLHIMRRVMDDVRVRPPGATVVMIKEKDWSGVGEPGRLEGATR